MRRTVLLALALLVCLSFAATNAYEAAIFGPKQYVKNWGLLNVYTDPLNSFSGPATIVVKNGNEDGTHRVLSALVFLNDRLIFGPLNLNCGVHLKEAQVDLADNNQIWVGLIGTRGSFLTIEIIGQAGPPTVSMTADPQSILAGESATLTWNATKADSCVIEPAIGSVDVSGSISVSPTETTTYTITATGPGGIEQASATVTVAYPTPTVTLGASSDSVQVGESATLTWTSNHAESCSIEPEIGSVAVNGSISVSPTETTTYTITATGPGGASHASVSIQVSPGSQPPIVEFTATPAVIQQGESAILSWNSIGAEKVHIDNGIGIVSVDGSTVVTPAHTTAFTITVTGSFGSSKAHVIVMVTGNPEPQPEGFFGEQYQDLIPSDATVTSYDPKRFSVITGLVHGIDDSPISAVSVTIQGYPEYGTAFTDSEGRFSLPVEGGRTFTVVYEKAGLLPAQRQVFVPWNDISIAETIQMIAEDEQATTISFDGNPNTVMTHQSTVVTDAFGSRACTMVFTGDNHAYFTDEQGNTIYELSSITTRATEYTTPESMPAELPPTSAFTYCAELTVDGIKKVRFEKPVVMWVDNFLGFEVGTIVPVGYYDRDRGVWVPDENGIVVRLLDLDSDGVVDGLDADGDGMPDDLDGVDGSLGEGEGDVDLNIFRDEVQGLTDSQRYLPGATFWRVEITHFSPLDLNWARRIISSYTPLTPHAPEEAIGPNPEGEATADTQRDEAHECKGYTSSFVEERSRVFHEDIPIPGTDMTLHYASNRTEGYGLPVLVPASGQSVPEGLRQIVVTFQVAGKTYQQALQPIPNQKADFVWDGHDYQGRRLKGSITATAQVGFAYDAVYTVPPDLKRAFGIVGRSLSTVMTRKNVVLWKSSKFGVVIPPEEQGDIAEGWTLSNHHQADTKVSLLIKGNGGISNQLDSLYRFRHLAMGGVIDTVFDQWEAESEGGHYDGQLDETSALAVDGEGNLYVADGSYPPSWLLRVDPEGQVAILTDIGAMDLTLDSKGNLYVAGSDSVIRRLTPNGEMTIVAGVPGGDGFSDPDGGLAVETYMNGAWSVSVDSYGNLYIGEYWERRVRRVDPSGIITTVTGNGTYGYSGDGGLATEAQIGCAADIVADELGNLYISDECKHTIRKVDRSGIITTVAGNGYQGYSGDWGQATLARLSYPRSLYLDSEGNLFIADTGNHVIRRVSKDGFITTVAGNGGEGQSGDGGPATGAEFTTISGLAVDPAGNLLVAESERIRRIGPPSPMLTLSAEEGKVFTEEDGKGYVMDTSGRHQKTIDLETGVALYQFDYDDNRRLVSIFDRFGSKTVVERDGSGRPTGIISPDGLRTALTIDPNNRLAEITYPDGSAYDFEYTPLGLMTAEIEPEGNRFEHLFDTTGRLISAVDEEGGDWTYSRAGFPNGDLLCQVLTAEGNLTSYLDQTDLNGVYSSTITDPTGAQTIYTEAPDGMFSEKALPCGMALTFEYDYDPEYKFKSVRQITERTPAGLERVIHREKHYEDTGDYGAPNLITEYIGLNGKPTALQHDVIQASKAIIWPEGRTVTISYDPGNLLTTGVSIPDLYDTHYEYDLRGRLTSIDANTRRTNLSYDAHGFLASITDPENQVTTYSHDQLGRVTGMLRPDGSSLGFTYDTNGNMTVLTNPASVEHGFEYNEVNLKSSYDAPISGSYKYVYDRDRRLIRTIFPSDLRISNVYERTNLVQIQTPEGNIDFTYLCGSKVGSITNGTESLAYGYDGKLVTSVTLGGTLNQTLSYTYDNDFNAQGFTYAGATTNYAHDNDGLLTGAGPFTISRNVQNGLPHMVNDGSLSLSRTFNGYGEEESENFTVGGHNITAWALSRDRNGRISSKSETVAGNSADYAYTYDPMGRLLTVREGDELVEEYRYDQRGVRIYEYDALRGISGRNFTYSDEEHLLTAGDAVYQYDLDGFLVSKTVGSQVTQYDYSSRGELLQVILPDARIIAYLHDPLGRRIAKQVEGAIIEKYLWQGMTRLLAIYDGSDNLVARFQYADGRMPFAMAVAGNTYYLTYDQVGSLRAVCDSSGNVVKRIDYDSFGNKLEDTNTSLSIPLGFAGGLWDPDTSLVRFGYRDYDPDVGRWTAKDPILFAGGDTDLYGYALNNPVNLIDPSGELFLAWHFLITASVGVLSGNGVIDSVRLGWGTVVADFGTQGLEPEQTNLHAMAGRGQTPEEAIEVTKRLIDDPCSADLASRTHAAQDFATPGHAGVPWSGFHFDLQTGKHILGDLFPSPSTFKNAVQNTAYVFYNAQNR